MRSNAFWIRFAIGTMQSPSATGNAPPAMKSFCMSTRISARFMQNGERMTTIVLFGGPSDERHVSVASAQNIVRALGNPLSWFWAPDGPVHDVAVDDLLSHQRPFEIDFQPRRPALWPNIEQALDTLPVDDPIFVLALHGGAG